MHISNQSKTLAYGGLIGILIFSSTFLLPLPLPSPEADVSSQSPSRPTFERIDAHAHAYGASPLLFAMLRRQNIRIIDISVVDKHVSLDQREIDLFRDAGLQNRLTLSVFRKSDGRAPWVSTFDPEGWESPGFSEQVNKQLDETFKRGAVGVKIYKSIGMELKSKTSI